MKDEQRRLFQQAEFLPLADGSVVSISQLNRLFDQQKAVPALKTSYRIRKNPEALRLPFSLWDETRRILGRPLVNLEPRLEAARRRAKALESLCRQPPQWLLSQPVEGSGLAGTVGLPSKDWKEWVVVLDEEGQPRARAGCFFGQARALVRAEVSENENSVTVTLSRAQEKVLEEAARELYSQLYEQMFELKRKAAKRARELLLDALLGLRRELGAREPGLAHQLADLPLFETLDNRLVSLSSLLVEAQERDRLDFVEVPETRRGDHDGLLPVAPEGTLEKEVLIEFFGRHRLSAAEIPGRFDQLGDLLEGAAEWGLEPLKERWTAWFAPPEEQDSSKPSNRLSSDKRLLNRVRSLFGQVVKGRQRRATRPFLEKLDYGVWPLGPPAYFRHSLLGAYRPFQPPTAQPGDLLRLNRANSSVRWLITHHQDDPNALLLLVVHLVSLVNQRLEEFEDDEEWELLEKLTKELVRSYKS